MSVPPGIIEAVFEEARRRGFPSVRLSHDESVPAGEVAWRTFLDFANEAAVAFVVDRLWCLPVATETSGSSDASGNPHRTHGEQRRAIGTAQSMAAPTRATAACRPSGLADLLAMAPGGSARDGEEADPTPPLHRFSPSRIIGETP